MIDFFELRVIVREYVYYKGNFPLLKDAYELYKAKFNYEKDIGNFGKELYQFQAQRLPIGFIEEDKECTYNYKNRKKPKTVIRKVKRIIIR